MSTPFRVNIEAFEASRSFVGDSAPSTLPRLPKPLPPRSPASLLASIVTFVNQLPSLIFLCEFSFADTGDSQEIWRREGTILDLCTSGK